jgi:hypothetical protein
VYELTLLSVFQLNTKLLCVGDDIVIPVGAAGTGGFGVTLELAELAAPVPNTLVAFTVNVYAVPLVNPVIVIGDEVPDAVMFPGLEVTVYSVIGYPPLLPGVNATVT